ncbi:MAG: hypothetical protein ACYC3X_07210 [Pirellulaceae bacterium]
MINLKHLTIGKKLIGASSVQGAAQTQSTGGELSTVAEQLRGLVAQYRV